MWRLPERAPRVAKITVRIMALNTSPMIETPISTVVCAIDTSRSTQVR